MVMESPLSFLLHYHFDYIEPNRPLITARPRMLVMV